MPAKPIISLIIPCYNEETNIQKGVLDKIGNYTKANPEFGEVIIVDDGSTDATKTIIRSRYLPQYPKFSLRENRHQGKAFAVISGIKTAHHPYVMFSDIDLATPIEEAEKLIAQIANHSQIIIGSRNYRRENAPVLRKVMAVGFIFVRNLLIGLKGIKDTQCGFKLLEKTAALKVIDRLRVFRPRSTISGSSVSAGFDLEFLFLAAKFGYKITEVPVIWRHVETKNVNFLKDSIETITDILKIKFYDLRGSYSLS
ncbi:glycosyltransferase [Patescibacteria group bacterium]|nr:glycosyltransferase [Patescibacteria group bacterium]MCL5091457.1 glycosyltransferase [Patescibacteria group bacterium]